MGIDIAKQIIDQRVMKIKSDHPEYFSSDDDDRRISKCFLLLGVASYLDIDLDEAYSCITDGGGDGGIDAARIEEVSDGQIDIVLFQSKYTKDTSKKTSFPANAVEKAVNTLKTVFDPSMIISLNDKCKAIIDEIRSFVLDGYIPYVTFVMVYNGDRWNDDGQLYIDNAFSNQEQVEFLHFGYEDILGAIEKKEPINATLSFSGKAIQEDFNYKRVILGRVNVTEIKRLMEEYGDRLLEKNVRRYLGNSSINDNISKTLMQEDRANFFFYNNGITMVCDKMGYNGLQEKDWKVKLDDVQIINGGQTCKTIYQTLTEHDDIPTEDVYVLVRIYELSQDDRVLNEITLATNHQNPVDLRDLKSNDDIQIHLEESARDLGYVYKRKRDASKNSGSIPSTVAAEAIFAIWKLKPHLAKYKKRELFDTYYNDVFDGINASQMILAVLIFRYCDSMRKKGSENENFNIARRYGNYFVACMVGKRMLMELSLSLEDITHKNFADVRGFFDENKARLEEWAVNRLVDALYAYLGVQEEDKLSDIDGRTMAAAFRRFDIVEYYIKNDEWWRDAMHD